MTVQQDLRQQVLGREVDIAAAAERVAPLGREKVLETLTVGREGINRREFLSYAWACALGLLTLESGLATYRFMSPRFSPGTFGGEFNLGSAAKLPATDLDPQAITAGKFWLINTESGPHALYMVCTHLGCLYKWEPTNNRFRCPCHASMFSREGHYIRGPARRSLDQFRVKVVDGDAKLSETKEAGDQILAPATGPPGSDIVVDTGDRIRGLPAALSPARAENEAN